MELLDRVLGLVLDELEEGVRGPLAAVLALGHHSVADVLQGGVLGNVEPGTEVAWKKRRSFWSSTLTRLHGVKTKQT